jgi:2,4-dienoyl-CoA reductase (NADPH2)
MNLSCRINAAMGGDVDYIIKPATRKKRVLVIGGGPSGMEAARVASLRGHKVTLIEKQPVLGGLIPIAGMVKGLEIEDLEALIKYLRTQIEKVGVDIRLGTEFKLSLLDEIKPDVVILAAGGVAATPDVPGIGRKNVIILSHLDKMLRPFLRFFGIRLVRWATNFYMPGGKKIIILGGTYYGCELAEFLIKRNKSITIVHAGTEDSLGEGMPMARVWPLLEWLDRKGVKVMANSKYEEINDKGLVITDKDGKSHTISTDTVMPSTLLLPNTELFKLIQGKVPEIYATGDCREPHMIIDAISNSYKIAKTI